MVLDAKRLLDDSTVCIKMIQRQSSDIDKEVAIARYLSQEKILRDPSNHSVPIFDSFADPVSPEVELQYLVMPLLRPFDDPEFWAIGEVVDFVTQILEVSCDVFIAYITNTSDNHRVSCSCTSTA